MGTTGKLGLNNPGYAPRVPDPLDRLSLCFVRLQSEYHGPYACLKFWEFHDFAAARTSSGLGLKIIRNLLMSTVIPQLDTECKGCRLGNRNCNRREREAS